jgi:hypothetical protein
VNNLVSQTQLDAGAQSVKDVHTLCVFLTVEWTLSAIRLCDRCSGLDLGRGLEASCLSSASAEVGQDFVCGSARAARNADSGLMTALSTTFEVCV